MTTASLDDLTMLNISPTLRWTDDELRTLVGFRKRYGAAGKASCSTSTGSE